MASVVLFPDAAAVVVTYLRAELAERSVTAVVGTRIPSPRPTRLVRVERTGGPRRNLVTDNAQLTVQCWAETEHAAQVLAQLCRGLVNAMAGTVQGTAVIFTVDELSGPQLLPDPLSEHQRYSQSFVLGVRGVVEV